jgi:hypothetical protein
VNPEFSILNAAQNFGTRVRRGFEAGLETAIRLLSNPVE